MKTLFGAVCLTFVASLVIAQDAELADPRAEDNFFIPERVPQTNRGFDYQRTETPRQLVHRNAALRAAQRRERMAINARFGYSPSRPTVSATTMGSVIAPPTVYRVFIPYPGIAFPRYYRRF
ncbi:MAG: hypothetical protein H8E66_23055 [Planctomycetes bacterium]|nr:hypothetical protein [Planctomycetota bacterium]